jgi:hypothetical protein
LARKVGLNGYWPQGNGVGKEWNVDVRFGKENDYGKFEVIALVVDNKTHNDLEKWVQNSSKTNPPFQSIHLPTMIDSCSIARLIVYKLDVPQSIYLKNELNRIERDLMNFQQYAQACRSYKKLYNTIPSKFKTIISNREINRANVLYDQSKWEEAAFIMKKNIVSIIPN